ncbi:hypothetical protein [Psychromonas ossibalaenae]|uniref:hypothetical protein n=1 Tax=Psychromonas ossibalaenae TaxID=444922 RepID=UPI00037D5E8F|nr:hypothetical protein [Psychromonas ossibalaenae]
MNKVFFLGIMWANYAFSEPFEISDVDVTTYQVVKRVDAVVPQAIAKPLCMSLVCNQTAGTDVAPKQKCQQ